MNPIDNGGDAKGFAMNHDLAVAGIPEDRGQSAELERRQVFERRKAKDGCVGK